jgi:cytochrome c biogenesis protein
MIPEGGETDRVYLSDSAHTPMPLGFDLTCKEFSLTYYDTGAPKEFRSDLIVSKDGRTVKEQSIVVNDPMKYGGLTFYQSSYQAMEGQFTAVLRNSGTGAEQRFGILPRREMQWPAEQVSFGITNVTGPDFMRRYRYKIWFKDAKAAPVEFWVEEGVVAQVQRPDTSYELMVKPRFATGLQVVKDPGVWTVYIGCIMQMLGLIIIFFMAHRRVWVFVEKGQKGTGIFLSGNSNKNKIGFEKDVARLVDGFEDHETLGIGSSKE